VSARSRSKTAKKVSALCLVLSRLLVMALSIQLSGVAHDAQEMVLSFAASHAEHEDQCPSEEPCNDCPPGCANCHCSPLRSLVPQAPPALAEAFPAGVVSCRGESRAPRGPDLPAIFRPPRLA
jgi:hypothetical protein